MVPIWVMDLTPVMVPIKVMDPIKAMDLTPVMDPTQAMAPMAQMAQMVLIHLLKLTQWTTSHKMDLLIEFSNSDSNLFSVKIEDSTALYTTNCHINYQAETDLIMLTITEANNYYPADNKPL